MKTSTQTTLPEYDIVGQRTIKRGSPTNPFRLEVIAYEIKCPRSDCLRVFWVTDEWWSSKEEFIGRSCPYCFKAGRIPEKP